MAWSASISILSVSQSWRFAAIRACTDVARSLRGVVAPISLASSWRREEL